MRPIQPHQIQRFIDNIIKQYQIMLLEETNNGIQFSYSSNANIHHALYSASSNSDTTILFLEGDSNEIKARCDELLHSDSQLSENYRSLRASLSGTLEHGINKCCLLLTVIFGSMLILPLLFITCDWWRRKTFRVVECQYEAYRAIAELIIQGKFDELYLTVDDHYFNQEKAEILAKAILKGKVKNLHFVNRCSGINTINSNYSHFQKYMMQFTTITELVQLKWDKKALTNLKIK